jgi:hypothetical protein
MSLEANRDAAVAISLLMILDALTVLVILRDRWLSAARLVAEPMSVDRWFQRRDVSTCP